MTDEFLPKSDSDKEETSPLATPFWGSLPETMPSQPQTQDTPIGVQPELSQNEIPNATGFNFGPLPVVTGIEENQEPAVEVTQEQKTTFENQDFDFPDFDKRVPKKNSLPTTQNKQIGLAICAVFILIGLSLFYGLGVSHYTEVSEQMDLQERAKDWPIAVIHNSSIITGEQTESCDEDGCTSSAWFSAKISLVCTLNETGLYSCGHGEYDENNTTEMFTSEMGCESRLRYRSYGDMPYACAAVWDLSYRFEYEEIEFLFPVGVWDESNYREWIVYDETCIWEGESEDVEKWSCYYDGGNYDTWWHYCEFDEEYGYWLCTDDLGDDIGSPDNKDGQEAPYWVAERAFAETSNSEVDRFVVKYNPEDPSEIFLLEARVENFDYLNPILGMAIPPIITLFVCFRFYSWAARGFQTN
jgi:hypothetical protein